MFDDLSLGPDRICGTVQELRHRDAAGECAIDADVLRIQDIADTGL